MQQHLQNPACPLRFDAVPGSGTRRESRQGYIQACIGVLTTIVQSKMLAQHARSLPVVWIAGTAFGLFWGSVVEVGWTDQTFVCFKRAEQLLGQ